VIRVRAARDSDAHAIAAACDEAEIARWTRVPSPYTLEDARAWIAMTQLQRERGTELQLVIVRAAEDRVVGGVALRLRTGAEPHGEIGYWVAAGARGEGIGSRAVRLIAAHGLETVGLPWIEITVSPRNAASLALAHSAGFVPQGVELREFKGKLEEFQVFRRPARRGISGGFAAT
jgi:RimJ/RimL family protein N-acetyltransferase